MATHLTSLLGLVQQDVGNRGLARVPGDNLLTTCPDDFAAACQSLAEHPSPVLEILTGFWIPSAQRAETDGPLGAVYLARTLADLGIRTMLVSEPFCHAAMNAGLASAGVRVPVLTPEAPRPWPATHRLAIERVGPSHTPTSVQSTSLSQFLAEVPAERHNRCHTMRGIDITEHMADVSHLFEQPNLVTIGIGDGGNEIGMGKIAWDTIRRNIPNGGVIACRLATEYLIVAGISNWGAYALAAGVASLRGMTPGEAWADGEHERRILAAMVEQGLVDGATSQATVSVDGLTFEAYIQPLKRMHRS